MAGPLKTLFTALQSSAFMSGVAVIFGKEEINTQRFGLPGVVVDPIGGPYVAPGFATDASGNEIDPDTNMTWQKSPTVDLWLYAASIDPALQGAIDHADAVEALEQLVLSALQDQQAQYTDANNVTYGFTYAAINHRWETSTNAVSPYNRSLVISVRLDVPIVQAAPTQATVRSVQVNPPT